MEAMILLTRQGDGWNAYWPVESLDNEAFMSPKLSATLVNPLIGTDIFHDKRYYNSGHLA